MGAKKCKEKNRPKVGWETEKFPHSHCTSVVPKYGMAEKIFVITVAPQNDICPHGRTYPKNATAIDVSKIRAPVFHVLVFVLNEWKYIPRAKCVYIRMKNKDAPFM